MNTIKKTPGKNWPSLHLCQAAKSLQETGISIHNCLTLPSTGQLAGNHSNTKHFERVQEVDLHKWKWIWMIWFVSHKCRSLNKNIIFLQMFFWLSFRWVSFLHLLLAYLIRDMFMHKTFYHPFILDVWLRHDWYNCAIQYQRAWMMNIWIGRGGGGGGWGVGFGDLGAIKGTFSNALTHSYVRPSIRHPLVQMTHASAFIKV